MRQAGKPKRTESNTKGDPQAEQGFGPITEVKGRKKEKKPIQIRIK
jgi:hypothetical protein